MTSQPPLASSGGAYRPESGTTLPYVCWLVSFKPRHKTQDPYVYDGFVILDAAQDIEATQLPLAAFRSIDRPDLEATVNGGGVFVDELDSALKHS